MCRFALKAQTRGSSSAKWDVIALYTLQWWHSFDQNSLNTASDQVGLLAFTWQWQWNPPWQSDGCMLKRSDGCLDQLLVLALAASAGMGTWKGREKKSEIKTFLCQAIASQPFAPLLEGWIGTAQCWQSQEHQAWIGILSICQIYIHKYAQMDGGSSRSWSYRIFFEMM